MRSCVGLLSERRADVFTGETRSRKSRARSNFLPKQSLCLCLHTGLEQLVNKIALWSSRQRHPFRLKGLDVTRGSEWVRKDLQDFVVGA
ncbi:unnamed protein product [Amoebophrya sp. A25]|nr:unnamed protein product [Amoebophrya sp. A25]|eukprot:GSA25T00018729001.1